MLRRAVLALLATAAFTAACGGAGGTGGDGGGPGPDAVEIPAELSCVPQSGARLRRLLRTHSDGTSVDVGVHDQQLGSECTFQAVTDGSLVCVPTTGVGDAQPRWLDPTCSGEMLAETYDPDLTAAILRVQFDDGDVCTNEPALYRAADPIAPDPSLTTAYTRTGDRCVEVGYLISSYVRLAGPADLATVTVSYVGGRLQVRQLDGADGSRFCDGFAPLRDAADDGRACELAVADDLVIRCVPPGQYVTSLYADAACGDAVEVVLPSTCQAGTGIVRELDANGCLRTTLRGVGALVPTTLHEIGFDGECTSYAGEPGHLVGAVVPPETYPGLTRTYATMGGRLERGDLAGAGLRIFRSQLRDADLDTPCAFTPVLEDGADAPILHCLPEASTAAEDAVAQVTAGFADEGCLIPLTLAAVPANCVAIVPRFARENTRVFRVGAATTTAFYVLGNGCERDTSRVLYELGEELPASGFVTGVIAPE